MRRRILILTAAVAQIGLLVAFLFAFQIYGPQPLVPPSDWPFTAESRRVYDPLGEHSVRTTKAWASDVVHGRVR